MQKLQKRKRLGMARSKGGMNMSSLYNMLFGENHDTKDILAALNLTKSDIERFRDCWINEAKGEIAIYTRTGGNNREYYPNEILTSHPSFLRYEDDDYDNTYTTFYFSMPEVPKEDG